jgi:hypothetical protein
MLDLFRKRARVRTLAELRDFLDSHAAFLVQRGIYEYSRARAGPFGNTLLAEPMFIEAAEKARWQAYPIGLAIVTEMADVALRPSAGVPLHQPLGDMALAAFDAYAIPQSLGHEAWGEARADLAAKLAGIGLHPPKPVRDIPLPYCERYFELMPIHVVNRGDDIDTVIANLRSTLMRVHDDFVHMSDLPALARMLTAQA